MDELKFSVKLEKIISDGKLEIVTCAEEVKNIEIENSDVNRPGLPIAGFFDYLAVLGLISRPVHSPLDCIVFICSKLQLEF